jgi:hypothetical protein
MGDLWNWIRQNSGRVLLAAVSVFLLVVAVLDDKEGLAITFAGLGVFVLLLAVFSERLQYLSLGANGVEVRLERIQQDVRRIEGKLDLILAPAKFDGEGTVLPPPPESDDDESGNAPSH